MPISITHSRGIGHPTIEVVLANAVATTLDGDWAEIAGFAPISVHVTGVSGATRFELRGSNAASLPASTDQGIILGTTVDAAAMVSVIVPVKYIKGNVVIWQTGTTVNARLFGGAT